MSRTGACCLIILSKMALRAREEDENRASSRLTGTIKLFSEELVFKGAILYTRRRKVGCYGKGEFKIDTTEHKLVLALLHDR